MYAIINTETNRVTFGNEIDYRCLPSWLRVNKNQALIFKDFCEAISYIEPLEEAYKGKYKVARVARLDIAGIVAELHQI